MCWIQCPRSFVRRTEVVAGIFINPVHFTGIGTPSMRQNAVPVRLWRAFKRRIIQQLNARLFTANVPRAKVKLHWLWIQVRTTITIVKMPMECGVIKTVPTKSNGLMPLKGLYSIPNWRRAIIYGKTRTSTTRTSAGFIASRGMGL